MNNVINMVEKFEGLPIHIEGTAQNPLFRAKDICRILGYENPRDAILRHVDGDDVVKRDSIDRLGRKQLASFVTESGMYALIFGSKLPAAKQFKKVVTSEILPAIRRTGEYRTPATESAEIDQLRKLEHASRSLDAVNASVIVHQERLIKLSAEHIELQRKYITVLESRPGVAPAFRGHKSWSEEEELQLIDLRGQGMPMSEIAVTMQRTARSVKSRWSKLNMLRRENDGTI